MVEVIVKKWGNSLGVILPKELIKQRKIRLNQKINLELSEKDSLKDIFGTLPRMISGQKFKDMARKGWQ